MKKKSLFSFLLLTSLSLSVVAENKKKIMIEYADSNSTRILLIDRKDVAKISFPGGNAKDKMSFTVNGVDFNMVNVRKGTFQMGATEEQESADAKEKPVHQVTLSKDYYMGETEVTQALWKAVMGSDNNPSRFKGDHLPVEMVSYNDIAGENGFLAKLNEKTGKTFRLPTEAEWEFAARGGNHSKQTQYSGSAMVDDVAWYSGNCGSTTHAVATKKANELDLYDMSGNVAEWCSDYSGNYSSDAQTDPTGASYSSFRIIRGGQWTSNAWSCRTSVRATYTPTEASWYTGFRLAHSTEDDENKRYITIVYRDGKETTLERSKVKSIRFLDPDVTPFTVDGFTFNMIKVKAGTFTMGATAEQGKHDADEEPTHKVTLTKDYYIGETEVTQALWKAVMANSDNPDPSKYKGDQLPVECVSYNDIYNFLVVINRKTGKSFRLPTEAEWEFAARGGNLSQGYRYSGSNDVDEVAWHSGNCDSKTHEVATKKANELGIYDMSGNVWEWCDDWYGPYSSGAQTDPEGPEGPTTEIVWRVLRGGSYYVHYGQSRSSKRWYGTPGRIKVSSVGFRIALTAK